MMRLIKCSLLFIKILNNIYYCITESTLAHVIIYGQIIKKSFKEEQVYNSTKNKLSLNIVATE